MSLPPELLTTDTVTMNLPSELLATDTVTMNLPPELLAALEDVLPQHALACVAGLDLHNGNPWSFRTTKDNRPLITRESCKCCGESMKYLRGLLPEGHPKGFSHSETPMPDSP